MILVADEGVDAPIVEALRNDGHEVRYVAEGEPGLADDQVLDSAVRHGAVLLTATRVSANWSSFSIGKYPPCCSSDWPVCRLPRRLS